MIETALDRLTEEGLLSEARYLESFVSYRARSGYGPAHSRRAGPAWFATRRYRTRLRESGIDWQEQLRTHGSASSPDISD
jgi:regulatory protein